VAYINVESGVDLGYLPEMDHRLLGYPYTLNGSPYVPAYMAAHGIPHPSATEWRPQLDWNELQRRAEAEWRLLLQVYSNEEANMDWAGGGVLHFIIPIDALPARDFTRVWAGLQFV
jgi:hypothetical protein